MKSIPYFKYLFFIIGFSLYTCDDFTEVDLPQTQLTGVTVFQNERSATAALSDLYARLRENGVVSGNLDGLDMLMGLYSDELTYYGSGTLPLDNFYNHTIISSNDYVSSLWRHSYSQIYAANALIEGVSDSEDLSIEVKKRLLGEAVFIRALLHFYLVNLYGDIPYITTTDYQHNSQVSRLTETIVYDKIIDDLEIAGTYLSYDNVGSDRVRVNRAAVNALLARMYAYRGQWSLAELYASYVLDQDSYSISPNVETVFLKNNPSTIWQLHPGLTGANTLEGRFFIFASGPPTIAAISADLLEAFEIGDLRKQHWIKSVTDGTFIWHHAYKYKQNANTGISQEYSIIFRLEELILIRAEARANQFNLLEAQQDLNMIRNRAGLNNTTSLTQEDLLSAIQKEKRIEFFLEKGHRWFDLKRTSRAEEVLAPIKPGWQIRSLLLPIPETELGLNPNLQPQNPGY